MSFWKTLAEHVEILISSATVVAGLIGIKRWKKPPTGDGKKLPPKLPFIDGKPIRKADK